MRAWLQVEAALAAAQAELGILTAEEAAQIAGAAADPATVDLDALWQEARNVGYPIFPLVRQLTGALPEGAAGRVHYGATTQDIMDSGLALQLAQATDRLQRLCDDFGDALVRHMEAHRQTTMAGRTHAQHAVPTTFGAKLAGYVAELARHRERLVALRPRVAVVSLAGAGGTAAALGPERDAVRDRLAERLGLVDSPVPWHVARDGLAEFGAVAAMLAATAARFAREVIDLSRTEVGEVAEAAGHHRGASSTMPQKANPIGSEAVIGMSASAAALSAALYRAMESGHERAAGEWQIEWQVLPQIAVLAAGALAVAHEVAAELRVDPERMARNLTLTDGRADGRGAHDRDGAVGRPRARARPRLRRRAAVGGRGQAARRRARRARPRRRPRRRAGGADRPGRLRRRPRRRLRRGARRVAAARSTLPHPTDDGALVR